MGRKTNEVKAKERFFRILLSAGFTDITKNFYKEKGYSEEVLANYSELIKRAFQKGKYIINCDYVIISAIWYRRSGRMVPPVSRCRIFHSGDVVPHQISFFDILVHQRV